MKQRIHSRTLITLIASFFAVLGAVQATTASARSNHSAPDCLACDTSFHCGAKPWDLPDSEVTTYGRVPFADSVRYETISDTILMHAYDHGHEVYQIIISPKNIRVVVLDHRNENPYRRKKRPDVAKEI